MSVAGGLHRALERGDTLGCFAVQIFVKNQRQWAAPPLRDEDVRAFRAVRRSSRIRSVFAHASYLINLASPDPAAWERAVSFFTDELERAEALGLSCVAIHPGSHLGTGTEAGVDRVARAVAEVLRRTRGYRVRVALENTAGAGGSVGRTFGELGALVKRLDGARRVGVCLDTCHLFAAGYDIRSPAGYEAAMAECVREGGLRACWPSTSTTRGRRWAPASTATSTSAAASSGCRPSGCCSTIRDSRRSPRCSRRRRIPSRRPICAISPHCVGCAGSAGGRHAHPP